MSENVEVFEVDRQVKTAVQSLTKSDVLLRGSEAMQAMRNLNLVITSDEEQAKIGDLRLLQRKAVSHVEKSMTDFFRPRKMFEKMLRDHFRTQFVDPMEEQIRRADQALLAWDTEKRRRADEERLRAEEAAKAAAAAVAAAVDEVEDDDAPPPGAAQVFVPEPVRTVKGAEATTFVARKLVASLEDVAEAMKRWPEAFVFDERVAARLFEQEGLARPEEGQHVLLGGVRFTVEASIRGRAR